MSAFKAAWALALSPKFIWDGDKLDGLAKKKKDTKKHLLFAVLIKLGWEEKCVLNFMKDGGRN